MKWIIGGGVATGTILGVFLVSVMGLLIFEHELTKQNGQAKLRLAEDLLTEWDAILNELPEVP